MYQSNGIIRKVRVNQGFTLVELLVVVGILSVVILGLIQIFLVGAILSDLSNRKTIAIGEAQDKMEEIRNHTYNLIATDYASGGTPGNKFSLSQINGEGVITIDSSTASLLKVDIVVSFQYKNGRIVGEDLNLNGVLDAGEDANGNGVLDSPVKLSTYFRQG
jgi:prepilin-type N-terminal cleavage/methylation domain-containing protein